jgi:hypothetical protein
MRRYNGNSNTPWLGVVAVVIFVLFVVAVVIFVLFVVGLTTGDKIIPLGMMGKQRKVIRRYTTMPELKREMAQIAQVAHQQKMQKMQKMSQRQ